MPTRRRYVDPATGDYVVERGRPREDATIVSEVVRALRTRRGSAAVFPSYGSRLYEIRKLTPDAPRLVTAYVREALGDLISRGEVRKLEVEAAVDGSRLDLTVAFVDRSGLRRAVPYTHRVG